MTPKDPIPPPASNADDELEAPPTLEELAEAEALRLSLEEGTEHPDADLARALRAAHAPADLDGQVHERILARVLEAPAAAPPLPSAAPPLAATGPERPEGGRVLAFRRAATVPFAFVAAAASVVLVLGLQRAAKRDAPAAMAPAAVPAASAATFAQALLLSRSAQDLFPEPFPKGERASRRVDRIAMARAHDLRENRFAQWGVR